MNEQCIITKRISDSI